MESMLMVLIDYSIMEFKNEDWIAQFLSFGGGGGKRAKNSPH